MNRTVYLLFFAVLFMISYCTQNSGFPVLSGPYLGQEPPGTTPEVFAPGIISKKGYNDALFCTYIDGKNLFLYTSSPSDAPGGDIYYRIYATDMKNGTWTKPYLTTFHNKPNNDALSLLPDGKTLYFGSRRSLNGKGESPDGFNIWAVKRTEEGFSNPRMIGPPLSSDKYDIYPSATSNGTIYFFSERSGGFGKADIYRSRLFDGNYSEVENIGIPVNTENSEIDPFIAPDESYLIYCSRSLDGFGEMDIYITFRREDGSWTDPVNMGDNINTHGNDWIPYVTTDGKYFFFTSNRSGDDDIYWVDARIIETYKPDIIK
ncbi:TolB family protein [candidate division KSB1 bacterium]